MAQPPPQVPESGPLVGALAAGAPRVQVEDPRPAADVMGQAADDAASSPSWWDLTVTGVERRSLGVAVLTVVPHAPLPYQAGQSLAIEAPMRPRLWRYYTPATLPGPDGSFELHVRLVPGGPVSTALVQAAQPGDVTFGVPSFIDETHPALLRAAVVLGIRIFSNAAAIRRHVFKA